MKATAEHNYRAAMQERPEIEKKKTLSQLWQKQRLKKQYRKQAQEAAKTGAKAAEETTVTTEKLAARTFHADRWQRRNRGHWRIHLSREDCDL